jgi:PAS domain S-box-containing protein
MPEKPLNVLIAEDNQNDAELVLRELRRAGFSPKWRRVDTEAEFCANLKPDLDIILSDYAMPQFSGLRALELATEYEVDVPFIIISGTIGEEIAVTTMQKGASDYLLKDRLGRLGQAVEHALEKKRLRTERTEARDELGALTYQHELIVNSAGEGIYRLDPNGQIVFVNPKASALLGWKTEELLGKSAHLTLHHSHHDGRTYPVESCPIHESLRDGSTRRVTNDVFWRKDGTSFRVDYVVAPIKDKGGPVAGSIVTFKDITDEFASQQRLKLQEEQYRLLFQTNPNSMWVFDTRELDILAVNDAAVAQYGYSREEFLNLTLRDLRPAEDQAELDTALSPGAEHAHFSGEFRHMRKDRSLIRVQIYSSPMIWDGTRARMVTAIDVTERNKSEEQLREQADIINHAHDAIIIRDFKSDAVTLWNAGAEHLYGWSSSEAIGNPLSKLIFTESNERDVLVEQLVSAGEYHGEIKHRTKDGREVIVDTRTTLIRNDDGTPRAVLGINTDVTEKKRLETQLLRAQRLESIGTLASGVAHDLNNVLTPILMSAEVLREHVSTPDEESALKLIKESARRGADIVKQVLTFARGVEGERVLIKPNHLIEEIIDIASKTFSKSIEISSRYPEDLWAVQGDPTQLHQVLLNLSVNARDAMANGGALVIWAENVTVDENYAAMIPEAKPGSYVALRVSDTGSGMPRATIEKIFDPFFTTKDVGKGTGLGLSSALGTVKSHGGFISVYSEPDKGTTFKVFLPAKIGDDASPTLSAPTETLRGNNELILVVDDEQSILTVTKMILENKGYRVITAHDGPEAVAIFAREMNAISAVLTDMSLPFMDGISLIRSLKKIKPAIPCIASTGQSEHAFAEQLGKLGVTDLLSKPYHTQKLLETLRSALGSKKALT